MVSCLSFQSSWSSFGPSVISALPLSPPSVVAYDLIASGWGWRLLAGLKNYAWTEDLALLLDCAPLGKIWAYILRTLYDTFQVSSLSVIVYEGDTMPEVRFSEALDDPEGHRIAAYLQGAYLLDPFFHAVRDSRISGCIALSDLASNRFRNGDYNKTFFTKYGLLDEVNIFFPQSSGQTVALSLGRSLGAKPFGKRTLSFLSSGYGFLQKLAERSALDEGQERRGVDRARRAVFHSRLKIALENAGRSLLSPREKDVLDHLLKGYSARATAEFLDISEGTVRIHRHSIYSKLDVNSQSELFALIVEALKNLDEDTSDDPLASFKPYEGIVG